MSGTHVHVRLRYPDVDTFVEKFFPNVTRGGVFLPTREQRAVGTVISFQLSLMDGAVALGGQGKVVWVREFNAAEPHRPHGLGLQFTAVDAGSRVLIERMMDKRAAAGKRSTQSAPAFQPSAESPRAPLGPTEFDRVEDASVRRMIDRARVISTRTDDLEALLRPEADDDTTVAQAVAELPRYLSSATRRNASGLLRLPRPAGADAEWPSATKPVSPAEPTPNESGNGLAATAESPAARGEDLEDPRVVTSASPRDAGPEPAEAAEVPPAAPDATTEEAPAGTTDGSVQPHESR